jgi:hypothetical protein
MKKSLLFAALALTCLTAQANPIITGIVDGDLSGGNPKAIELWIDGTVDLSLYSLERSANGGAFSSVIAALSGTFTDQFVYLVGTSNGGEAIFDSVFGTTGIFAPANRILSSQVNGNGNDAFRIMQGATVIDQVWTNDITNVYVDSYMYRKDNTGPDGGWVAGNWDIPGNATLDTLDAAGHAAAIPFGTYVIPEPSMVALLLVGFGIVFRFIRRK